MLGVGDVGCKMFTMCCCRNSYLFVYNFIYNFRMGGVYRQNYADFFILSSHLRCEVLWITRFREFAILVWRMTDFSPADLIFQNFRATEVYLVTYYKTIYLCLRVGITYHRSLISQVAWVIEGQPKLLIYAKTGKSA